MTPQATYVSDDYPIVAFMLPKIVPVVPGGYDYFREFKFWTAFQFSNCDPACDVV